MADSIAKYIVDRRLETPAVLFFEMHKPVSFLASQAAIVAAPLLGPLVGMKRMADLSRLLSEREYVELLISRIEEMAAERDKASTGSPQEHVGACDSQDPNKHSSSADTEVADK
ncbi:MAG: hypothetical protein QHI38_02295 [Armatimonadota bacterium]|nr:hypothetical protein [Armatimonadota bacterium]